MIDALRLEAEIRRIAREEAARPLLVTQRTVETVVGVPRRDFLRLAREGAFPSTRERRLVVSRTADVLATFESRLQPRSANDDTESAAFARAGVRRVAP